MLKDVAALFKSQKTKHEIIVVNDGSKDKTSEVALEQAEKLDLNLVVVEYPKNRGKGGAVRAGMALVRGQYVLMVDADGATSPKAFHDLVKLRDQAECVIASRWLPGAVLHQQQTGKRQFASRVFHFIVQSLFWLNIKDTQCGAKVMRREVIEKVHPSLCIADMAFDINLLYAIKRAGFKILEVPTEWTDKMGSKVVLGRTSLTMLLSIIRLRLVHSPFYRPLRPLLRPLETWVYAKLKAPLLRRPTKSWDTDFTH